DGDIHEATGDAAGRVSLAELETGLYRLTASREGYVRVVERSLRAVGDKTIEVRLRMRAANEGAEEVEVVAEAVRTDPYGAVSDTFLDREPLRTAAGGGSDVLRALDGLPGLVSSGEFASFTVRGRGPRDNLILVDDIPYDKVVHFDESLGEQEDIT